MERRNYYGFQHGNYLKTNVDMGTVKFEHDVNSHITLPQPGPLRALPSRRSHYRGADRRDHSRTPTRSATPLGQIDVLRNQITVNSTETFLEDQADVTMRFRTGSLRHTAGRGSGRRTRDLISLPSTFRSHYGSGDQPAAS